MTNPNTPTLHSTAEGGEAKTFELVNISSGSCKSYTFRADVALE
jgi:hypothetical protein